MPFTLTVTNAGRAALVNAARDGTNAVRIASVGVSAASFTLSAASTGMPAEIKRITTIAGDAVAADTIHVTVRDESSAAYTVRSIALYLADGTMFAAYTQAAPLVEKSAQAMLLLALDVRFADIAATSLTFGATDFLNPPATTEALGVVELATDAEANAGTDDRRAVTPKGLSFTLSARLSAWGSDIWRASNDGAGSGLDADLLDGQHGSYYANIAARLGYTPANRAGDTFTGNVGITNGGILLVDAGASNLGYCRFHRTGRTRWDIGIGNLPETGGNAGSDFFINRFDDNGNFLDTPFQLYRATGEARVQGGRVWHAGNDGAGSGLDADLLDGQDSSFFVNIPARLGYSPANRAGDTFTGNLAITHAGTAVLYLEPGPGKYAFNRFQRNARARWDIGMTDAAEQGGNSGSDFFINRFDDAGNAIDSPFYIVRATGELRVQGGRAWHSGNDGAGSGLDADLLDGQDSSFFVNIPARLGYTPANRAGDTFTGNISLAGNLWNIFYFETVAGAFSLHRYQRGGRPRWDVGMNSSAESGGASGSDYFINRFDDAGSVIDTPFLIYRATGELRVQGGRAWHSGNDGAGSGLDADLLDGQDSSFYTNIAARLGYSPANRGGDVFTGLVSVQSTGLNAGVRFLNLNGGRDYRVLQKDGGNFAITDETSSNERITITANGTVLINASFLAWHSGNDGAGSGLDADLLDGRHGSDFALNASLGDVWRSSNDGAGSGLDADLLDGRQATDFVLQSDGARFGSNANGYWERRPNGVIEQWGTINGPFSEGQQFVTFPIPFTNADSVNISGTGVNSFANNRFDITIQRVSRSTDGCSLMVQYTAAASSINQIDAIDWRAVGV